MNRISTLLGTVSVGSIAGLCVLVAMSSPCLGLSPCGDDRDCAGYCARASGVCCDSPCDYCTADEAVCLSRCVGDCDEDGAVEVAELVVGVRVVLGAAEPDACPALVGSDVGSLVTAVGRALSSCPASLLLGQLCDDRDDRCAEGICQDGVCCEEACGRDGDCGIPGFEGLCIPTGAVD